MKNKLAAIEGILFSMGTSVTRRQLMEALEIDNEQFDELIVRRGNVVKGGLLKIKVWEI